MSVRILSGHVLDRLAEIAPNSVQVCVTSPPYYGLRSYGTEPQVWGGDTACAHEWGETIVVVKSGGPVESQRLQGGTRNTQDAAKHESASSFCQRCTAWRGELGQEPTLALYLDHLLMVFDAVRRVLRDDGTCWVNLGDSFNAYNGNRGPSRGLSAHADVARQVIAGAKGTHRGKDPDGNSDLRHDSGRGQAGQTSGGVRQLERGLSDPSFKPKDLMLVPARFAIRMQEAGWWVRNDNIWAKTACMPESVTDRATRSHEYVWHFAKSARYYYDAEAVKETSAESSQERAYLGQRPNGARHDAMVEMGMHGKSDSLRTYDRASRNQRTVWTIGPEPLRDEHYAAWPTEIPRRCILAGSSEKGQCPACGAPWVRVVERTRGPIAPVLNPKSAVKVDMGLHSRKTGLCQPGWRKEAKAQSETLGWSPSCACDAGDPTPQTILDPFIGSGRTGIVADRLGRDCIGIELSPANVAMSERLIRGDSPMFATVEVTP